MVKYNLEDFGYDYKLYAKYLARNKVLKDLKKKRRVLAKAYLRGLNCNNLVAYCNKKLVLNKK